MFSNIFFRNIRIVTNKKFFVVDFVKNKIIENEKVISFKDTNKQIDLIKKNIMMFKKRIITSDYSLSDYDELP